jgi:hypothetical protein
VTRTLALLILGLALCLHGTPARAQTATAGPPRDVSAAQVCQVQNALRWQRPAWSAQRCCDVAAALSILPEKAELLAVMANESNMNEKAIRWAGPRTCDVGATGIRCILGDNGKCTNGAARGYTVAQLQDPLVNVRVGHVLATLKGPRWLHRWNGSPGYAARIAVLASAIAGEPVVVTGTGAKWARIRAMVARIARAANDERKS